jgi:hypothetical protein
MHLPNVGVTKLIHQNVLEHAELQQFEAMEQPLEYA